METIKIQDVDNGVMKISTVYTSASGIDELVASIHSKEHPKANAIIWLRPAENLQLIQALEVAQKELDPSYQTREELQTQLTELLNRANG